MLIRKLLTLRNEVDVEVEIKIEITVELKNQKTNQKFSAGSTAPRKRVKGLFCASRVASRDVVAVDTRN